MLEVFPWLCNLSCGKLARLKWHSLKNRNKSTFTSHIFFAAHIQSLRCVKEMRDAIELVDRLQKKQTSVLSSLKLATGASSSSDQVDGKIVALKYVSGKALIIEVF